MAALFSDLTIQALWVTFTLAGATTVILLIIGAPMAWWLARFDGRLKPLIEAVIALPLILPPTVLGFYLLIAFSPDGPLGAFNLAFSFSGILIGSVVYSLPFVVQPLQNAFAALGRQYDEAAAVLGAGPFDRFFNLLLPMTKRSFISAATLGFAHTVGEFGVVLMIGGNIPGQTQVLSIALFDHVEALEYGKAHALALGLVIFSLVSLSLVNRFKAKDERHVIG